jgi:hypothetical protein
MWRGWRSALRTAGAPVTQRQAVMATLAIADLWLAFTRDPDRHPVGVVMAEVPGQR